MGLIYLDACVLVYLVEPNAAFSSTVAEAVTAAAGQQLCISPLVQLECLVGPIKRGNILLQRQYESFFDRLLVLDIPEPVYRDAAVLRCRFALQTPDALHLACAQYHHCDAFWTNDDRLARAAHGMARNVAI